MPEKVIARGRVPELFDRNRLSRQIRNIASLPPGGIRVVHLDTSQCSERGDLNALAVGQIFDRPDGSKELWILNVEYGRWTPRLLPENICDFLDKWSPYSRATIEQIIGSSFLKIILEDTWERRGQPQPKLLWISSRNAAAKSKKIGRLVRLSREGKLNLVAGSWNEEWLCEAEKWSGLSSNHGRTDDCL
jgi:hypothetical protein